MYTNNKLAKSIRLALMFGGASVAVSGSAFAQDESETGVEAEERIQVTGSRIQRTDYESASPVQITSAEEIKLSGFTRIEDLMNSLPQVEAAQTSFIANGSTGTATVDLRGLGANRTLVLVNGRRLQPGGLNSEAADVNQIPAALVKRVEVLTGGGSATYGSDAVAGVVNFVMNDDFEGVEITVGSSGYQHNNDNEYIQGLMDARGFDYPDGQSDIDGKSFNIDLTVGSDFADGKGHATAYATWRSIDELRQEARDYSSCALNAAGIACGGSGTAPNPNFYFVPTVDGVAGPDEFDLFSSRYTLDQNSNFVDGTSNVYNYAPINHFMRPDERYTFGTFVNYEINEYFRPYMEASFMHNLTRAQIAESGTFGRSFNFAIDSDVFTPEQQAFLSNMFPGYDEVNAYILKRNVEGGPRVDQLEHNSFRVVVGSQGYLNDMWSYDLSFQYGRASSSSLYKNDFYIPFFARALQAEGADPCTGSCIPYEVFEFGGVTPEAAAQLGGVGITTGLSTQRIINGYVTGEFDWTLPSASYPVAAVFGFENRELDYEVNPDQVFIDGALSGQGGPTPPLAGGYNVRELFTEFSVPLVNDADWADSLVLDLGFRYSDYNTSGGENTYKIALDYNPNDSYKIRASYNRAVRAPSVAELFSTQSVGLWSGTDPCAGATPEYTAAECANTGVDPSRYGAIGANPADQYNGFFGGNPELQPEIADTYAFGVVGNPIENLNFSVDYWTIEIEDVIGAIGPELTLRQCAETGNPTFCDNINRDGAGSLWLTQQGFVSATSINLASRKWEGVDVSGNYLIEDFYNGSLSFKLIGSYMMTKEYDPLPGVDADYDCAGQINSNCFPQPDWRHTATAAYESADDWTASLRWRYLGAVEYDGTADQLMAANGGIGSQSYIDLTGAFVLTDNISAVIGINNILDRSAPIIGGATGQASNGNTVAGFYDTLGRYMHASVTFRF